MKFSRSIQFAVALAAVAAAAPHAATPPSGAHAPDFVLKSVAGNNIRLSEYRGEIVMLAFWASWCGDCRDHMESVAEVHERYRDAGVALVAVSLDQDRRSAESGAESLGAEYPVLHDAGGEVGRLYDIDAMPTLLLIDRAGVVRDVFTGFRRADERQYLARVRDLLRES